MAKLESMMSWSSCWNELELHILQICRYRHSDNQQSQHLYILVFLKRVEEEVGSTGLVQS